MSVPLTDPQAAADYEVRAARDADRRLAYEEAARHWTTALRLVESGRLGGSRPPDSLRGYVPRSRRAGRQAVA